MKFFIYLIIIVVAAAIVSGFFIVGSPQKERLRQFDQQRVSNLQDIQNRLQNYWVSKSKLPERLSDLNDEFTGSIIPRDPQTGSDYEYVVKATLEFSLCTTFNLPNTETTAGLKTVPYPAEYGQYNWQHPAGHFCFDRKIDKELYPPKVKTPTNL